MHKLLLFVKRRWVLFFISFALLMLVAYKISEQRGVYYNVEASIILIGKEGAFSPQAEIHRIADKDFINNACGHIQGLDIDSVKKNLTIEFSGNGIFNLGFVSKDPEQAVSILNLLSGHFIEKRSAELDDAKKKWESTLNRISSSISRSELELSEVERELRDLRQRNLGSDQRRQDINKLLEEARLSYQELSRVYTDQHPDIINIKAKIGILESQLKDIPDISPEYNRLESLIESQRSTLNGKRTDYQQEYERIRTGSESWRAEIIKKASIPKQPLGAGRQLYLAIGIGISLFSAFFISIISELADKRVHTGEEAEAVLGVPVIADIGKVRIIKKRRKGKSIQAGTLLRDSKYTASVRKIEQLYTYLKVNTFKGDTSCKSVLVTSVDPRAGKSFVAYNLALTCAKNGERVLLVDANFHNPIIGDMFNLDRDTEGLSDILRDSVEIKNTVKNMTDLLLSGAFKLKDTHIAGLDHLKILLPGSRVEKPFSLLSAPNVGAVLKALSKEYGLLIIDSACLDNHQDSLNLVAVAGISIVIAKKHRSKYPSIKSALRKTQSLKYSKIGVVLTDV